MLFVVLSLPGALLGPLLGVPIDRLGPKRTLLVANLLGVLDALALTQANSYLQIVLLALPLGLIEAFAAASLDAIPPRLVASDDLVAANALLGGAQDVAIVFGPLLAAVVNEQWGLTGAFLADAATFAVGALVALTISIEPAPRVRRSATRRGASCATGSTLARRTPGLRWTLVVVASVYLLWALFGLLEPLYVRDVLGESDEVFALLQTVFGVGLVLTSLALAKIGDRVARPRVVAIAVVVSGLTAALYLGTQSLAVAFVGVFLWGVDVAFFYVPAKTLLQRFTPGAFHGRILSLNQSLEPMAGIVMTPLGALLLGFVERAAARRARRRGRQRRRGASVLLWARTPRPGARPRDRRTTPRPRRIVARRDRARRLGAGLTACLTRARKQCARWSSTRPAACMNA